MHKTFEGVNPSTWTGSIMSMYPGMYAYIVCLLEYLSSPMHLFRELSLFGKYQWGVKQCSRNSYGAILMLYRWNN